MKPFLNFKLGGWPWWAWVVWIPPIALTERIVRDMYDPISTKADALSACLVQVWWWLWIIAIACLVVWVTPL